MFTSATMLLAGLVILQTVNAMIINNDPCFSVLKKDVKLVNTTECDKFISCHQDAMGHLYGETISCAFGTYWSDADLTCVNFNKTKCLNDKCKGLPDGTILPAEDNCRGYWICGDERAVPHCCPQGETFNNETVPCVEAAEGECNQTCFLDMSMAGNSTENETTIHTCTFFPVDGEPKKYQQEVAGHGFVIQSCGEGTIFDSVSCDCANDPSYKPSPSCKPEVHLTFTNNAQDESGKGYWVKNNKVDVQNGTAFFNDPDSYLSIPRFTSLWQTSTFVVKMKYHSLYMHDFADMAILSNAYNCHTGESSILMKEDAQDIVFHAMTTNSVNKEVRVSKFQTDDSTGMKEVTYKFHNNLLEGHNGVYNGNTTTDGYLVNTFCDLTIGQAPGAEPFLGVIDEMSFYLCSPDDN